MRTETVLLIGGGLLVGWVLFQRNPPAPAPTVQQTTSGPGGQVAGVGNVFQNVATAIDNIMRGVGLIGETIPRPT